MDAQSLFPGPLGPLYDGVRAHLLALDHGVIEEIKTSTRRIGMSHA